MSFYPDSVNKYSRIGKIMELTGWEPRFFYWQYQTVCDYEDKGEGINRYCKDIRKSTVDRAFTKAFGYSSFKDPNGEGKAVIKSEENFAKDGRIVDLPYELGDDEVCQKVLDTYDGEHYRDLRILIVNGTPTLTYEKRKPNRFDGRGCTFHKVRLSEDNRRPIREFCNIIGMDYGELDMLNGYIIDANKTPGGASKVEGLGEEFINAHKPLFRV